MSRLLHEIKQLDVQGITVKCFDLLMRYEHHAACYPFAYLQNKSILCACEGELSSLVGMVFLRQAFGNSGIFMCNYLSHDGSVYKFAHCTAPLCGLE